MRWALPTGAIGGADRFQIAAGGHYGSACCDAGTLRVGRADLSDKHVPAAFARRTAQTTLFVPIRGVWVSGSITLDGLTENASLNSYGLYDAANPTRSFVGSSTGFRDPGGDISSIWTTDPVRARRRAYRRLMGYLLDGYLSAAVTSQWMVFRTRRRCLGGATLRIRCGGSMRKTACRAVVRDRTSTCCWSFG
jgi:hypothetical protein